MPMSDEFRNKVNAIIRQFVETHETPFYLFYEKGMLDNIQRLKRAYNCIPGFKEYFAMKALPNIFIARILYEAGLEFDLSSPWEVFLTDRVGANFEHTYFSSNNTSQYTFKIAAQFGVKWLNLDDIRLVPKVPNPFPKKISLRYNPGSERVGNHIIGDPANAKYGHTKEQLFESYRMCLERGAEEFGIHAMICSNELSTEYHIDTVKMLLALADELEEKLNIRLDHFNEGGGFGIPYRPGEKEFDIEGLANATKNLLDEFRGKHGWAPKPFMECGRYITGPYGILVARVINRKEIYKTYVGVDANASADLMRAAMYGDGAYHHMSVIGGEGRPTEIATVTGALCENNDRLANNREIPVTRDGDIVCFEDCGAHVQPMGNRYNGWGGHGAYLIRLDGSIEKISRNETFKDYIATQIFEPEVWRP